MTATVTTTIATIASAVTATATSATFTAKHVQGALDFFVGSWARNNYLTGESQVFASMWVIQVYSNGRIGDFTNSSVEMMTFIVLQRYDATGKDVFIIKNTVDGEHVFAAYVK